MRRQTRAAARLPASARASLARPPGRRAAGVAAAGGCPCVSRRAASRSRARALAGVRCAPPTRLPRSAARRRSTPPRRRATTRRRRLCRSGCAGAGPLACSREAGPLARRRAGASGQLALLLRRAQAGQGRLRAGVRRPPQRRDGPSGARDNRPSGLSGTRNGRPPRHARRRAPPPRRSARSGVRRGEPGGSPAGPLSARRTAVRAHPAGCAQVRAPQQQGMQLRPAVRVVGVQVRASQRRACRAAALLAPASGLPHRFPNRSPPRCAQLAGRHTRRAQGALQGQAG
jgi:hypothetical protein